MASVDVETGTTARSPDFGKLQGLAAAMDRADSLEMFRRIVRSRQFDWHTQQEQIKGRVRTLIYLSYGQESIAAGVSMVMKGSWIFGQHRAHSVYISFGGDLTALVDEMLELPTGCNGGMGGSPPIQDFKNRIVGHNGLIGDQVPVACGLALRVQPRGERVICFLGDGAMEEDYVLAAMGFAATRKLPILFVCEDNDLSVLTTTEVRRSWSATKVAESFGLRARDISDDPWLVEHTTRELSDCLPALLNVRTCRNLWHVGTGNDGPPEWDRYELTKQQFYEMQMGPEVDAIEREISDEMSELWRKRLQIQSES